MIPLDFTLLDEKNLIEYKHTIDFVTFLLQDGCVG